MLPKAAGFTDALSESSLPTVDPAAVFAGLRVLVAEDHEIIRLLTCTNLIRLGASVVEATDGIEAVELASQEAFDLVLLDISMPRLDGDQAASQIRSGAGQSARAKIIGVTAHQTPLVAARLSNSAFDAFLTKPLNFLHLASALHSITQDNISDGIPISEEILDAETLKYVRAIGDDELFLRALKSFAEEIADAEVVLDNLLSQQKTIDAGRLAHKLSGICQILGAKQLSAVLLAFEDLANISDAEDLRKALLLIKPVFRSTLVAITKAIAEDELQEELPSPPKVV